MAKMEWPSEKNAPRRMDVDAMSRNFEESSTTLGISVPERHDLFPVPTNSGAKGISLVINYPAVGLICDVSGGDY